MTVSATAPFIAYAGAGMSGPFAIPFRFLADADLVVTKINADGVEITLTGNTITGAGDDDGGELNTAAVVALGETLRIYRDTGRTQTAQYVANGPFPAATHERALDKAMLVAQEQDRDIARALLVPMGEAAGPLPSADERANKLLGFDSLGQIQAYIANGLGVLLASLINYTLIAVGSLTRTIQDRLGEAVYLTDFTSNIGGSVDDAFNAAIAHLAARGGGTLLIPAGVWDLTTTIDVGNGSAAPGVGGSNTLPPIRIKGVGPVCGVGDYAPNGGAVIRSSALGPTFRFRGTLGGGLEDLFFSFTTANPLQTAVAYEEVQSCTFRRLTVLACPGVAHDLSTFGNKNTAHNRFEELFIFMSNSHPSAVGIDLRGPGVGGNVAFNTFDGVHITPDHAGHVGVRFGYSDNNEFARLDVNPSAAPCAALFFDYTGAPDFPQTNKILSLDIYNNTVGHAGSPSPLALGAPNSISSFSQTNGAVIPENVPALDVARIRLTANKTFYVSPSGSDTLNTGLTVGGPKQTLQAMVQTLANYYDLDGYTATIQAADGTYTSGVWLDAPVVNGDLKVFGNLATPGSTALTAASGDAVKVSGGARIDVQGFLLNATGGSLLVAQSDGAITFTNCVLGAAVGPQIQTKDGGSVEATGNYFVNGGGTHNVLALDGGRIKLDGRVMTILANLNFTTAFAEATTLGLISARSWSATGAFTVTGSRYLASVLGLINTGAGGASYFPGSAAGTEIVPGKYA